MGKWVLWASRAHLVCDGLSVGSCGGVRRGEGNEDSARCLRTQTAWAPALELPLLDTWVWYSPCSVGTLLYLHICPGRVHVSSHFPGQIT
jgi:hypothetical protein